VICEIMKDDGTMARLPDLELFAQEHGLKIGTIADLIGFRSQHETLVTRAGTRRLATPWGEFDCAAFRDRGGGLHLALSHGRAQPGQEVLVRVHEPFTAELRAAPAGVAVLLNCAQDVETLLPQVLPGAATATAAAAPRTQMDLRTYGVGAQILREMGVTRMQLLGRPRRMPSMTGYGLEVTGFRAPEARRA
jgi:3,4-dihydroxy 2-butanone 4-phosphate synthase/GTP cyclohydrolase II